MMRISEKGITLIKEFEGCSLTAYPDPGTGGDPWTIGYGWTHSVDGKPVKPGMMIDEATAERLLKTGLVGYENDVSRLVKVKLTQGQFQYWVCSALAHQQAEVHHPGHTVQRRCRSFQMRTAACTAQQDSVSTAAVLLTDRRSLHLPEGRQ